jgi:uncharacterized protein YcbX
MESVNLAVLAPYDEDRGVTNREVLDKVVAAIWNHLLSTDVEPDLAKDMFSLFLKILAGYVWFDRERTGS